RNLHTFIDGREYWSESIDLEHRERIRVERARLVAKLIEKSGGDEESESEADGEGDSEMEGEDQGVDSDPPRRLAERIMLDNLRAHHRRLWLEGKDLAMPMKPGDCGCGMAHMGVIR
ncbi:MAG: hypothetical protein AAFN41_09540, partial [Planctomycetota bacterium]